MLLQIDNQPSMPVFSRGGYAFAETAVIADEDLAEIPRKAAGHLIRAVDAACLREHLEKPHVIGLIRYPALHVAGVKRRSVDRALNL